MADRTRCSVETRVELVLEVDSGPFGPDWTMESAHKMAQGEARNAATKLVHAAAEKGLRVRITKVDTGCTVRFEPEGK